MIFFLKISTFDLKNIKEVLLQLQLKDLSINFNLDSLVVYPLKKIRRTVLRAPHGDKKTGQDALQIFIYTATIQISLLDLKTFLKLSNLVLKNCNKIEICFLTKE